MMGRPVDVIRLKQEAAKASRALAILNDIKLLAYGQHLDAAKTGVRGILDELATKIGTVEIEKFVAAGDK